MLKLHTFWKHKILMNCQCFWNRHKMDKASTTTLTHTEKSEGLTLTQEAMLLISTELIAFHTRQ